jgi:hypothetical protein
MPLPVRRAFAFRRLGHACVFESRCWPGPVDTPTRLALTGMGHQWQINRHMAGELAGRITGRIDEDRINVDGSCRAIGRGYSLRASPLHDQRSALLFEVNAQLALQRL